MYNWDSPPIIVASSIAIYSRTELIIKFKLYIYYTLKIIKIDLILGFLTMSKIVRYKKRKFEIRRSFNYQHLSLNYAEIDDLTQIIGLDKCNEIESLSLSSNKINKIEALDTLTNLKILDVSNNQISKIENIECFPLLEKFCANNNNINKIEGLEHLQNLRILELRENNISKIEGLNGLNNLWNLDLGVNPIKKIENLDDLGFLQDLSIYSSFISP